MFCLLLSAHERLNLVQHVFKISGSEPFNPQEIPDEYFDCFGEVGTLKNTYHIELKDDVQPVVVPLHKLSALRD